MGKDFRVSGYVQDASIKKTQAGIDFILTDYHNHQLKVSHKGFVSPLFSPKQPVVVEGRLQDAAKFLSCSLIVQHNQIYSTDTRNTKTYDQ